MRGVFATSKPDTGGKMPRKGYYSPVLRRDLVTRLYHAAKDARLPMTKLQDRLLEDALNRITTRRTSVNYQDAVEKSAA
jgi:hypothetical protein